MDAVRHAWSKDLEPTQFIEEIPAADVVEVVRCRDCKHFDSVTGFGVTLSCCHHEIGLVLPNPDGFCNYGERKDGE